MSGTPTPGPGGPRIALIHLVSDQTMQNLLPALALTPERIVHLATRETHLRSLHLMAAISKAAPAPVDEDRVLLADMPGIEDSLQAAREAIRRARAAGCLPVVNFTGGTKLMSIGAYSAARQESTPSIYVDTKHERFIDGESGPPLTAWMGDDRGFSRLHEKLTLDVMAAAHGCEKFTSGESWVSLSKLARHLLDRPGDEQACWKIAKGKDGLIPGREPDSREGWLALAKRPIRNLPGPLADMACEAGLIAKTTGEPTLRLPPVPPIGLSDTAIRKPLQAAVNFLSGGWWEVSIADRVRSDPRFRDVRWQVEVGGAGYQESVEEDVLAMDGVQAAYFSCKRGGVGSRLGPHLEELQTRAERIGGSFTRKFLCVYSEPSLAVRKRARQLKIRILTPRDLADTGCLSPGWQPRPGPFSKKRHGRR